VVEISMFQQPKICKAKGLEELQDDSRYGGIAVRGKNAE
jgi:hypothetical protein